MFDWVELDWEIDYFVGNSSYFIHIILDLFGSNTSQGTQVGLHTIMTGDQLFDLRDLACRLFKDIIRLSVGLIYSMHRA